MRIFRFFLVAALLTLHIYAQSTERQPNCESPEMGSELIACAAARHKVADAKLSIAYKQLRSALRKQGESLLEERLATAQRNWLKFQKSHCDLEATYEGAGGSFVSAKIGDCMAGTTTERAKYLEELLRHFN